MTPKTIREVATAGPNVLTLSAAAREIRRDALPVTHARDHVATA